MRILAALSLITLLELLSPATKAAGLPLVISATVDYTHNTLTISGQNFGSNPAVTLDALAFSTQSSGSSQIVANFPSGKAPSSFTPGTYFLTVQFRNQLPTIFAVDIGASGAQGPVGPAGAPGVTGPAGATGPAGPAGPQGIVGPMGPPGATGSVGATGAQGLQGVAGPAGPQGLQGATGATGAAGPQGVAGANGTNGSGTPICAASDTVVSYQGALVCKSTLPRYVDNGDGTITDNQTGLMWEKKTGSRSTNNCCTGDLHDVNNTFTWSASESAGINPDGSLYTIFLASLNLDSSIDAASECFLNHCDWRIPTVSELQSILQSLCNTPSCIDPIFGATTASGYWSTTSVSSNVFFAWSVGFFDELNFRLPKSGDLFARAVRNIR
jgi:Protein of unknown function (DUF1566)/Collagen triple helix repeat (20 copies)